MPSRPPWSAPGHLRLSFAVPLLRLDTPVQFLKGIGDKRAEALARLGVHTAQDLLLHLPHRYIDASSVTPLAQARVGDDVACVGTVTSKGVLPTRKGSGSFMPCCAMRAGCSSVLAGQAFLDRTIKVGQCFSWRGRSGSTTGDRWPPAN